MELSLQTGFCSGRRWNARRPLQQDQNHTPPGFIPERVRPQTWGCQAMTLDGVVQNACHPKLPGREGYSSMSMNSSVRACQSGRQSLASPEHFEQRKMK